MKNEKKYVSSLESYLDASDEDRIVADGIFAQLPAFCDFERLRGKKSVRILDVGSGNGSKALFFAKSLSEKGPEVRIDSVEPKAEQRRGLAKRHEKEENRYAGKVYETTLGEADIRETYDFVLTIHSLYEFPRNDDGTIRSLDRITRLLAENGVWIAVIEHADGDFQKLKREFYPGLNKKPPVSQDVIRQTLENHGMKYRQGEVIDFELSLEDIRSVSDYELGKGVGFLFSDSLDDRPLSDSELSEIGKWLRGHARKGEKGWHLWTPDMVLWIYGNARR